MKEIHINLLDVEARHNQPSDLPGLLSPRRRRFPVKLIFVLCSGIFILASTGAFSYQVAQNDDSRVNKTLKFFDALGHFAINPDRNLHGQEQDRINIALLGIGGEGHEGGQLTDTIIIASIQPSTHRVALISLPRDLLVNIDGYGLRKINNANAFGELKGAGSGPELARSVISSTLNMPIHYYVKVDFAAFKEIVDIVGGVSVVVDQSFTDYTYPTLDKKYQTISFAAGPQLMDGDTALKYARSRHSGMNNEGSDFARSKRQQKVLISLKEKLTSTNTFLNPQKISDIINSLQSHVVTDLKPWELLQLLQIVKGVNSGSLINLVLDDSPTSFLYPEMVEGAYVLRPKGGDFSAIQSKVTEIFTEAPTSSTITTRKARVIVKNGTKTAGLAGRTAEDIKSQGFTILSFGNATRQDQDQTVIYNLAQGGMTEQGEKLKDYLKAEIRDGSQTDEPDPYRAYADFIVILGKNTPGASQ